MSSWPSKIKKFWDGSYLKDFLISLPCMLIYDFFFFFFFWGGGGGMIIKWELSF